MQREIKKRGHGLCHSLLVLVLFAGCSDSDTRSVPNADAMVFRPFSPSTTQFVDVTLSGWPPTIAAINSVQLPASRAVSLGHAGYTLRQDGDNGGLDIMFGLSQMVYQLDFLPESGERCPCASASEAIRTIRMPRHVGAKTLTLLDPAGRTLSTKPLPAVEQAKTIEASSAINVATIPPKTLVPCSAPALELTAPAVETGPELEAAFTDVAFSSAVLTLPSASLKVISEALARLSPKLRKGLHSIGRAPISGPRPSHGIRCSDGHVLLDSDLSIIDDGQRKHLMRAIAFCAALGIVREQDSSDAWIKKWQALWEAATQTPPGSPRSFLHPLGRRSVALDVAITVSEILADPDAVAFVRLDQGLLDQRMGLLLEAGLIDADQLARARCKSDSDAVVLRLAVAGIAAKLPVYINGQTIATLPAQKEAGYQRVALRLSSSALKLRSIGNRLVINVVSAEGDIDDIQLFGLSFVGRYGVGFFDEGAPIRLGDGTCDEDPNCQSSPPFYLPSSGVTYERLFDWGNSR